VGAESCNFPTDSCKFPSEAITGAHKFTYAAKWSPKIEMLSPNKILQFQKVSDRLKLRNGERATAHLRPRPHWLQVLALRNRRGGDLSFPRYTSFPLSRHLLPCIPSLLSLPFPPPHSIQNPATESGGGLQKAFSSPVEVQICYCVRDKNCIVSASKGTKQRLAVTTPLPRGQTMFGTFGGSVIFIVRFACIKWRLQH